MSLCLWLLVFGYLSPASADEAYLNDICEHQSNLTPVSLFFIVVGSFLIFTGGTLAFVYLRRKRTDRFQQNYVRNAYANVFAAGETPASDPLMPYPPGGADEYYRTHHPYGHRHRYNDNHGLHAMDVAHMARDMEATAWRVHNARVRQAGIFGQQQQASLGTPMNGAGLGTPMNGGGCP
ncbi:hypothetical protein B0H19DRAFT_1256966 [Mycena capillaripes]|nr:hypothetical protein B0H19DRAFT_1256966 [Mycena capillaripes]